MFSKLSIALLLSLSLVITACGGGGDSGTIPRTDDDNNTVACTDDERQEAIYDLMRDVYYWYEHVPDVDPTDYSSPDALLSAIRYKPLDSTFSYLTTVAAEDAFLNNAAFVGFGFSTKFEGNRLFLRESFEGGPAHDAGMRRGDEIIAIDGTAVSTLISTGQINSAFGPNEEGYTAEFEYIPVGESESEIIEVSKAEVNAPIVGAVHTDLAENVAYIFFRSFVNPAFDQLDEAFADIKAAGVTRLILDLRYNGGGLLTVTEHLGGLIAGNSHEGTELATIQFNDRYSHLNSTYLIEQLANSTDIDELVVITTGGTASASEMIINGLQPHMNVTTVGDNTYGKPVGQSRLEFCEDDILRAVTFKVVNSEGMGEYFPPVGIAPTCPAEDDIAHALGDANEASVAEALNYLETGSCSDTASIKAAGELARQKAAWPQGDPMVRDGWDVLTGGVR